MAWSVTRQRNELHAVDDCLGATKRVPLSGLDVRCCDGLCTLEEWLRVLRGLSSEVRRQPKLAFSLRDIDIGIWKDAPSILGGHAADVIGMEVGDQNHVDFFRRVACAAEAARQAPDRSPTKPSAAPPTNEDNLLARVDQETRNRNLEDVRIFVQFPRNTIHRRLAAAQPVPIQYAW